VKGPEKRLHLAGCLRRFDPAGANAELARLLAAETNGRRRLSIANFLMSSDVPLTDAQHRLMESELLGHMRHGAGTPRLDAAAKLAIVANAEGEKVYRSFLEGTWRPRANFHSNFYRLRGTAYARGKPSAARARELLTAAISSHPDPNVRAAAIRALDGCLGIRGADGKGFPLVALLIADLVPQQDWRVRSQAGLMLRRAFREALPNWDYYHFWPPEKQTAAAATIRDWWQHNAARVAWMPFKVTSVNDGYFVLKP